MRIIFLSLFFITLFAETNGENVKNTKQRYEVCKSFLKDMQDNIKTSERSNRNTYIQMTAQINNKIYKMKRLIDKKVSLQKEYSDEYHKHINIIIKEFKIIRDLERKIKTAHNIL